MFSAFQACSRVARPRFLSSSVRWCHQPRQKPLRRYTTKATNPVEKLLLDRIKATGPIPFATYMRTCLTLPQYGYYSSPENPIFGSKGDFITSPDISQMFGELMSAWFVSQWLTAGRPKSIRMIELGPGRGTLMSDVLRLVSEITGIIRSAQIEGVHLVETSQPLREIQASNLARYDCPLQFHDTLRSILPSNAFSMVIAHEYFDALPFHLLQKSKQGEWLEVLVASTASALHDHNSPTADTPPPSSDSQTHHPPFCRVLSPKPTAASLIAQLSPGSKDLPVGALLEVSPETYQQSHYLAKLIKASSSADGKSKNSQSGGGCGLIVDYGDAKSFGSSFRAFKDHKIVDVFQYPGKSDLTVNVDFALVQEALKREDGNKTVITHGPITQADFLNKMGLQLRAESLQERAPTKEQRDAIRTAAERLVDPIGMGKEYKFLGFTSFPREDEESKNVFPFAST